MQPTRTRIALILAATVALAACESPPTKEDKGTVAGAVVGGVVGSTIGGGTGRTVAIVAGTLIGGMVGKNIGRKLDDADRMKAAGPERSFFYASGRASNEAGFLFQMLARLFGTNYVNNCSYYCHQASGVGLGMSIGTGAGTVRLEDLQHTDLYLLIGANPSSNHPRLMRSLMEIRRRGGKIIVVNPLRELGLENFRVPSDVRSLLFGTEIASQYVQPHIGGDLALLNGIAKDVLEHGGQDQKFVADHTEGFDEFLKTVQATTWGAIVDQCGVDRETIRNIADQYMKAKNVVPGR